VLNRVPQAKLSSKPVCGMCKTVLEFPRQPLWAKRESYDFTVVNWPETLLIVFTAPMCVYCKIVDPVITELARERAGRLKVMKVDTESDELLSQRFKVKKTPTFIVYKNGVELIRVDGAPKEKNDLVTWIDNLIGFTSY
jgi:thioredoxin 2